MIISYSVCSLLLELAAISSVTSPQCTLGKQGNGAKRDVGFCSQNSSWQWRGDQQRKRERLLLPALFWFLGFVPNDHSRPQPPPRPPVKMILACQA